MSLTSEQRDELFDVLLDDSEIDTLAPIVGRWLLAAHQAGASEVTTRAEAAMRDAKAGPAMRHIDDVVDDLRDALYEGATSNRAARPESAAFTSSALASSSSHTSGGDASGSCNVPMAKTASPNASISSMRGSVSSASDKGEGE